MAGEKRLGYGVVGGVVAADDEALGKEKLEGAGASCESLEEGSSVMKAKGAKVRD